MGTLLVGNRDKSTREFQRLSCEKRRRRSSLLRLLVSIVELSTFALRREETLCRRVSAVVARARHSQPPVRQENRRVRARLGQYDETQQKRDRTRWLRPFPHARRLHHDRVRAAPRSELLRAHLLHAQVSIDAARAHVSGQRLPELVQVEYLRLRSSGRVCLIVS